MKRQTIPRSRAGRLAAWFSYPLSQADYAEAWGIGALPAYQPA